MSLLYDIYRRKTTTEEKRGGVLCKHAVLGAVLHLSRDLGEVLMSLSQKERIVWKSFRQKMTSQ